MGLKLLLRTAIVTAVLTPAGSLSADEWNPYWKEIYDEAVACVNESQKPLVCWENALPEKCKVLVYPPGKTTEKMRSWFQCAISCEDAGLYSRTFGECSK